MMSWYTPNIIIEVLYVYRKRERKDNIFLHKMSSVEAKLFFQ